MKLSITCMGGKVQRVLVEHPDAVPDGVRGEWMTHGSAVQQDLATVGRE